MDSALVGDDRQRTGEKATKTWVITAVAVLFLLALATTAYLWLPELLGLLPIDEASAVKAADWLQLSLWLLAALVGAVGAKRALDLDQAASLDEEVAVGGKTVPYELDAGTEAVLAEEGMAGDSDYVSFYTDGGVCIRTENSLLEETEDEGMEAAINPIELPTTPPSTMPMPQNPIEEPVEPLPQTPLPVAPEPVAQPPGPAVPIEPLPVDPSVELPTMPMPVNPIEAPLPGDPEIQPLPVTPPSAPQIATPFNLPADLPDFTGREQEVAEVCRRLSRLEAAPDSDDHRFNPEATEQTLAISGLAGMGGIGKTALALHVGHRMAADGYFPDARLYLDLKGTAAQPLAPSAALKTLLTALLGADPERPEDEESLARIWRNAMQGRHALVILDNAAGASQVRPLLPGSPSCTVLVTSRQRFALPGALLLDLNRLSAQDSRELLQTLAPRLDDAIADEIADRCGGLPLALRIAGNYLALNDDFPAEEYAARLADERGRMEHLRDPLDPDLDVAATLSLSVAQLDVGNRWAWTMLSLFPAPFDSRAASALWGEGISRTGWVPLGEETTIEWLSTLRNRSLVTYDASTDRYRLHDLLHLAASQEIEDTEGIQRARGRLAYHFLDVVHETEERQRYLDLDPDWPHVQAALEYASEETPALLSELVLSMDSYWEARGMAVERAHWSDKAALASADAGNRSAVGVHMTNQGSAFADRGDARRAIEVYGRALAISRTSGDQQLEGIILGNLGLAYQALGDARRAIHYGQQALDISRVVGDRRAEGIHLGNLGNAYTELGDPRRAVKYHEQALVIARELGDRRLEGTHLGNLGRAHADLGDAQQAITGQKEALAIHRDVGNLRGEGQALDSLGRAYSDLGQPDRALDYYEQALDIARATGDRRGEGADLSNLGLAYAHQGNAQWAMACHEEALSIAREVGDRRTEGTTLGNLGRAYQDLGQTTRAMEAYNEALEIARQVGDRRSEATWLGDLGQAYAELGDLAQAASLQEQALEIYREIGDRRNEGNYLANLGLLARQQGDEDGAHQAWTNALQTLEAMKDPAAGRVWQWLADLEGQPAQQPGTAPAR
jgi:tetratricopeptide (TPR) repeat protein